MKKYEPTSKAGFYSAFRYQNLVFYGGKVDDLAMSAPWDVIVKLDRFSQLPFPKATVPVEFPNFAKIVSSFSQIPLIEISWSDGNVPELNVSCWQALVKDFKDLGSKSDKDLEIAVCCMGGHGRTGTALAILKNLFLKEKKDPVESLRKTYLQKAVETTRQIEYVEHITGREVKAASSYSYGGGGSSYYASNKSSAGFVDTGGGKLTRITDVTNDYYKKDGDLGSIAIKTNKIGGSGNRYPVHLASECVGKNCPDKDSKWRVHCAKKSARREGVVNTTTVL